MENWGLVTFQVGRLLFDPLNSSLIAKQMVAITLAHEVTLLLFFQTELVLAHLKS